MVGVAWGQPALDSDWRPTGFVGHWGAKPQEASFLQKPCCLSCSLPLCSYVTGLPGGCDSGCGRTKPTGSHQVNIVPGLSTAYCRPHLAQHGKGQRAPQQWAANCPASCFLLRFDCCLYSPFDCYLYSRNLKLTYYALTYIPSKTERVQYNCALI